jgi:hypothetical protein
VERNGEVVSPELVLVDPQLAERRRPIELVGSWTPAVHAAAIRARPRGPIEIEAQEVRPRRRLVLVAGAATIGAGLAAAALLLRSTTPEGTRPAQGSSPPQPNVAGTQTVVRPAPRPKRPATSSAPVHRPAPVHRATRVSWRPVRFATFYHVVFAREGGRRLELWTRRTTLSVRLLRGGRGLKAGRYRWSVRPGYGNPRFRKLPGRTFYGPVVVRGLMVVPVSR